MFAAGVFPYLALLTTVPGLFAPNADTCSVEISFILQDWAKDGMTLEWVGPAFADDSAATRTLRGHFFYTLFLVITVPLAHVALLRLVEACLKKPLPEMLHPPLVRRNLRLCVSVGRAKS